MAGRIQPIAALTVEDRGPINTILSIFLPITSILVATVRMAMRKRKFLQFEPDDIVFGTGLGFAILTSVVSHLCVRAGLGRHQDTFNQEQVAHYFKLSWITQILGVIALGLAKLSLTLLIQRIFPRQIRPRTIQLLMPMIAVYTVLCLSLIVFQCELPRPWILSPRKCSTHGNVYYPVTIFNMLTDAMLAIWMFPIIRSLQTKAHTKSLLLLLFGSRLLICVVDIGRMIVIHQALRSEDQTRSRLLWSVMDQIVVHFSLNHATLPRIQAFLSHLQIGPLSIHVPGAQSGASASRLRSSVVDSKDRTQRRATTQLTESQSSKAGVGRTWSAPYSNLRGRPNRTPSISEQPLRYQQETGIELSTTIYAGKGELGQTHAGSSQSVATSQSRGSLSREEGQARLGGVMVQNDIAVSYDEA